MTIVQVDLDRLNYALQFAQELIKPVSAQNLARMVQEAIIPPAPPKDAPKDEKAVEASAEPKQYTREELEAMYERNKPFKINKMPKPMTEAFGCSEGETNG